MAILEIARIQVRRGQENVTGVPQLDSGEFGWAVDTQQLYIGNGSLAEGAPTEGNTRIMTENDLFAIYDIPAYNYIGHSPAAPLVTSPYNDEDDVVRTIQSKLDDFVTIYDFGGSNDGAGYNDLSLQQALNEIYLNSDRQEYASRVALRIPAGRYVFSSTIFIPPYTTIIGDGQDKTVLEMTTANQPLFQFFDYDNGPITINGFNGTFYPRGINIIGVTFKYSDDVSLYTTKPLVYADASRRSYFVDCKFLGSYVPTVSTSTVNYAGIEIRSQDAAIVSKDLVIDNCSFDNLYYAIKSDFDIEDTVITKSTFKNLNRAIVFNEYLTIGNDDGVIRTKIHDNKFNLIEREAIFVGTNTSNASSYNVSSYNTFKEVGNNLTGDLGTGITPIINFQSQGNVSKGDFFVRFDSINNSLTTATFVELVQGSACINGESVYVKDINAGNTVLTKFPHNGKNQIFKIQYTALWDTQNVSRTGELTVSASTLGVSVSAPISDSYSYTGPDDGGLIFTATLDAITNTISVEFTTVRTDGIISYQYNQLQ